MEIGLYNRVIPHPRTCTLGSTRYFRIECEEDARTPGMPLRRQLFLPALVLALTTYSTAALAAPDASAPPVPAAPTAPTAASSKRDASAKGNDNDDLVRMGASLLDNGDLIRMGANLLEERVDAGADAGADAGRDAQDAEVDASDDAAALPDTGAQGVEGGVRRSMRQRRWRAVRLRSAPPAPMTVPGRRGGAGREGSRAPIESGVEPTSIRRDRRTRPSRSSAFRPRPSRPSPPPRPPG